MLLQGLFGDVVAEFAWQLVVPGAWGVFLIDHVATRCEAIEFACCAVQYFANGVFSSRGEIIFRRIIMPRAWHSIVSSFAPILQPAEIPNHTTLVFR